MADSDALRLEIRDFSDAANWDWVLKDAAGQYLAAHPVRLDPASPEYRAMTQLPVHLRWEADPERLLESQPEVLGRVGRWMGERVFGEVGPALAGRAPVTALIVVPPGAEGLRHWPLELAWVGQMPLALSEVSLVIDVGRRDANAGKEAVGKRLRMLAAFSLSASEPLLMLSQQRYELVRSIERVATSKARSIDLVTLQHGVTRQRLIDVLEEGEGWDVVHFSGHGLATELLLERADGRTDRVPANELIGMLRRARRRLKLLVLSSCDSGAVGAPGPGPGSVSSVDDAPDALPALAVDAARQLDCAVLGMRYRVGDDFSIQLVHHLYDSLLAKGNLLPRALQLALPKALEHGPEPGSSALSVATPVLFGERAVDLSLVPPPNEKPTFRPGGKMSYFGREPDLFVGRVEAMAAASRALSTDDSFSGILFYGPEATGKTACAVELAYLYKNQFSGLVRHQAPARGDSIAGSLVALAEALETQLQDFGPDMKDAVRSRTRLDGFLPCLTELMEQHAIFMLIDGIDTLLTPEGSWQDDMWRAVVDALLDHDRGSKLVLTSRRPLVPPHGRLCAVPVPVLSPSEALLLARQLRHLGDVLRGRTEWPMDRAMPLLADILAAAGGMPGLIRAADKELTSPGLLDVLAARVAEQGFAAGTADKREEYLGLVRKWTRGIRRSSNTVMPPGQSTAGVMSPPVPGKPAEPSPSMPAPSAGDLDGLGEQHVRLLQTTAVALETLLDSLRELGRTPLLWSGFAEVINATRHALSRVEEQLVALEGQVTVMSWPHPDFAVRLASVRAEVQRDVAVARFDRATESVLAEAAKLCTSAGKLLDLLKRRYPSLFSDNRVAEAPPDATHGASGERSGADMADPRPPKQVPVVNEPRASAGTERVPARQAAAVPVFSGAVKVEFCQRIGPDWEYLADALEIPSYERWSFNPRREPHSLWEWLEIRGRLPELANALTLIGRTDLAEIMRPSAS
jgi:hypothetical protein